MRRPKDPLRNGETHVVATARQDVVLIHERLKTAQTDYEVRYAKKED
jgi:hypothetical protein